MIADLACAIADGAEVISDFRVMGDQDELFGLVASSAGLLAGAERYRRGGAAGHRCGSPWRRIRPAAGVGRGGGPPWRPALVRVADWAERHDSLLVLTWGASH